MSGPLRVVDTGLSAARYNVAITAAIAELHRTGQSPDTLRFHLSPPSVAIGRERTVGQEVDLRHCRRNGVDIARRQTAGETFYLSPGILVFDVVAERRRFGASRAAIAETICGGMAAALSRFGLPARHRSVDTIDVAGSKVCVAGGMCDGPTVVYQGAVLIAFDVKDMAGALARRIERTSSLSAFLGRVPDTAEVKAVLTAGLADAWGMFVAPSALTAHETALADQLLLREVGLDSFVAGTDGVAATKLRARRRRRLS
jgi:lipoate-protein ligase A